MARKLEIALASLVGLTACDDGRIVGDLIAAAGGGSPASNQSSSLFGGQGPVNEYGGTTFKTSSDGGAPSSNSGLGGASGSRSSGGASNSSLNGSIASCGESMKIVFNVDDTKNYCAPGAMSAFEIRSESGEIVVPRVLPAYRDRRCDRCNESVAIGVSAQAEFMASPYEASWDGSYFTASTCGVANYACGARQCVTPGRYIARFCLVPKGTLSTCVEGDPSKFAEPTACVEVPFDFPSSRTVTGMLATSSGAGGNSSATGGAGPVGGASSGGSNAAAGGVASTSATFGVGGATAATSGSTCIPGCQRESVSAQVCAAANKVTWICDGSADGILAMFAAGCVDAGTSAARVCCTPTFQPSCP